MHNGSNVNFLGKSSIPFSVSKEEQATQSSPDKIPIAEAQENEQDLLRLSNISDVFEGKIGGKKVIGKIKNEIGEGVAGSVSTFTYCYIGKDSKLDNSASQVEYIYKRYKKSFPVDSMHLTSRLHDAENIGGAKLVPCLPSSGDVIFATLQKYEGSNLIDLANNGKLPPIEHLWPGMKASLQQMLEKGVIDIDFKPDNFTWNKEEQKVKRIDLDNIFAIDAPWKDSFPVHTQVYTPYEPLLWKQALITLSNKIKASESLSSNLLLSMRKINPDLPNEASKEDCLKAIQNEWIQTLSHIARYQIAVSILVISNCGIPYISSDPKKYSMVTRFNKQTGTCKQKEFSIPSDKIPISYHEEIYHWLGLTQEQKSPFARMFLLAENLSVDS
jgi:hypothetical protein